MMVVIDPFHNRLVFHQPVADEVEPRPTEAAAPIELTYELACTAEEAFDAFTRRIDEWWHPAYAPEGLERVEIDGDGRRPGVDAPGRRHDVPVGDGDGLGAAAPLRADVHARPGPRAPEHARRHGSPTRPPARRLHGPLRARRLDGGQRRRPGAVHRVDILLDRFAAVAEGRPVPDVPAYVTEGGGPG